MLDFNSLLILLVPISLSALTSGLIAGLFGVGGGIILVPAIVFTLEYLNFNPLITMHIGIATSLMLIIPTSISSIIKDLGEHPEDKKPVRIMKGQYGPYIKYKSLNATIPEEKDPVELTMEEALILIEKRREYDKNKKSKGKKKK